MTNQTLDIILLSKKAYKNYPESRSIDRIIHYLSDTSIIEKEYFRDFHYELTRIIKNNMYDYIDNCDTPSDLLKSMERVKFFRYDKMSELDCILEAFRLIQVISNDRYINGFNEESIKESISRMGGEL